MSPRWMGRVVMKSAGLMPGLARETRDSSTLADVPSIPYLLFCSCLVGLGENVAVRDPLPLFLRHDSSPSKEGRKKFSLQTCFAPSTYSKLCTG
jgi:hypothetical protein